VHKDRWEVQPEGLDRLWAKPTGRFLSHAEAVDLPVVGDWVDLAWQPGDTVARIEAVAPRRGCLTRKRPGDSAHDAVVEQVIAANIDVAIVAMAVNSDFSVRRLERYLTLAWDSGATPVVVLTKADLASDLESLLAQAAAVNIGASTLATSCITGQGLDQLRSLLPPGCCAIVLGSSGVGKSSLLNALAGQDLQVVSAARDFDGKGRHTTTSRRLVELPWGAYLVDTPGLRELQLWGDEDSLTRSFPDVDALAQQCRFSDCVHDSEPGCAVQEAVASGELGADRLKSWRRLHRELAYLARKTDGSAARAERQKWKAISKRQKALRSD
jgi:ribosome biogenesis GTPase